MIYDSILDTIGNTPVVRLNNIAPANQNIFAKVESFNPLGSVKDRLAFAIIQQGERSGRLKPGQTVVEATSGNTGIALAMVCAAKGYPFVATMAESFSIESVHMNSLNNMAGLKPTNLKTRQILPFIETPPDLKFSATLPKEN